MYLILIKSYITYIGISGCQSIQLAITQQKFKKLKSLNGLCLFKSIGRISFLVVDTGEFPGL